MPSRVQSNMAPAPRRRKIGQLRRLEDEADDEPLDILDDDTASEPSLPSEDNLHGNDSDTSNVEESVDTSTAGPSDTKKPGTSTSSSNLRSRRSKQLSPPTPAGTAAESNPRIQSKSDPDYIADAEDELDTDTKVEIDAVVQGEPNTAAAPIIVSSSLASKPRNPTDDASDPRHKDQVEYRRKRDADPSFVPNRGSFFMHDYRSAAPAGNGFRPVGRGGRSGRGGRGGIGGPYAPINHMHGPPDPLTSNQWSHDMHEAHDNPVPPRPGRRFSEGPPTSYAGDIPKCEESKQVINRHMSTERQLGNTSIRIFVLGMEEPKYMPPIIIKQYTMLPDHRPPLRRDKPARVFLEGMPMPKHIFPATDRSFIFIPRAMRPNQQRGRGKVRSTFGSIGGFSRRTSVFGGNSIYNGSMYGGSMYGGSMYSPSVAMSRRSSIALGPDMGRDMISPAGSTISRPPMPMEPPRPVPVVRLPQPRPDQAPYAPQFHVQSQPVPTQAAAGPETSISNIPQPQMHLLPDKPTFENRHTLIPMHQPTPKRGVSVENIESPTLTQQQNYQQAFHHQVPVQAPHPYDHTRQPSYASTGTPLSQIPEKAIHAIPFQPTFNQGGSYYNPQTPQMVPPQQQQQQQQSGYYYPPPQGYPAPPASTAPFMPGGGQQQAQMGGYSMEIPMQNTEPNTQTVPGSNTVGMEVNGTVFYSDASQMQPQAPSYPNYQAPYYPPPGAPTMNMGGPPPSMGPVRDGYYYPPQPQGSVYYQQ